MDDSTKRNSPSDEPNVSRRRFLTGLSGSLAAAAAGIAGQPDSVHAEAEPEPAAAGRIAGMTPVTLTVNGKKVTARVDPRRTLLEMLRTDLDLTGAKQVCNHGACGACTVIRNGRTIYSCMALAVDCEGASVETIENLDRGGKLHPLQAAFVRHDALQCGFCTPGFVLSCKALLDKNPHPTLDEIKTACAGNICRCGTYPKVFEAVLDVAKRGG